MDQLKCLDLRHLMDPPGVLSFLNALGKLPTTFIGCTVKVPTNWWNTEIAKVVDTIVLKFPLPTVVLAQLPGSTGSQKRTGKVEVTIQDESDRKFVITWKDTLQRRSCEEHL